MRIFQAIEGMTTTAMPAGETWYRNLFEPLQEMGHDVILHPVTTGRLAMQSDDSVAKAAFSEGLVEHWRTEHRRKPFDLFFSYLMDGMVEPGAIDEIRKYGVPMCNFSCNNSHQFDLVAGISPHFDYCLHSEKDA